MRRGSVPSFGNRTFVVGKQVRISNEAAAMIESIEQLKRRLDALRPLPPEKVRALASVFHAEETEYYPFVDGNGRTCRLAMNLHLLQQGYPLTILRSENNQRVDYYNALAESDSSDAPDAFRRFIETRVHQSLLNYLAVMEEAR